MDEVVTSEGVINFNEGNKGRINGMEELSVTTVYMHDKASVL